MDYRILSPPLLVEPSIASVLVSFCQSLRGETAKLWVLECLKTPFLGPSMWIRAWLCLKVPVGNHFSTSTLKMLIQWILEDKCVMEKSDANHEPGLRCSRWPLWGSLVFGRVLNVARRSGQVWFLTSLAPLSALWRLCSEKGPSSSFSLSSLSILCSLLFRLLCNRQWSSSNSLSPHPVGLHPGRIVGSFAQLPILSSFCLFCDSSHPECSILTKFSFQSLWLFFWRSNIFSCELFSCHEFILRLFFAAFGASAQSHDSSWLSPLLSAFERWICLPWMPARSLLCLRCCREKRRGSSDRPAKICFLEQLPARRLWSRWLAGTPRRPPWPTVRLAVGTPWACRAHYRGCEGLPVHLVSADPELSLRSPLLSALGISMSFRMFGFHPRYVFLSLHAWSERLILCLHLSLSHECCKSLLLLQS